MQSSPVRFPQIYSRPFRHSAVAGALTLSVLFQAAAQRFPLGSGTGPAPPACPPSSRPSAAPATCRSRLAEGSSFTSVTNRHGTLRCTAPRRLMAPATRRHHRACAGRPALHHGKWRRRCCRCLCCCAGRGRLRPTSGPATPWLRPAAPTAQLAAAASSPALAPAKVDSYRLLGL